MSRHCDRSGVGIVGRPSRGRSVRCRLSCGDTGIRRIRRFTIILAGLLLPVGPALGGAESTAPRVQRVTLTAADSGCIGNPVTPACAVETLFACAARLDFSLCERIGLAEARGHEYIIFGTEPGADGQIWRHADIEYLISDEVDSAESLRSSDGRLPAWAKKNDVVVGAQSLVCEDYEGPYHCIGWLHSRYVFRPVGKVWKLVAGQWGDDSDFDVFASD